MFSKLAFLQSSFEFYEKKKIKINTSNFGVFNSNFEQHVMTHEHTPCSFLFKKNQPQTTSTCALNNYKSITKHVMAIVLSFNRDTIRIISSLINNFFSGINSFC